MNELTGKVFWVTGASSGIGKALCESLANRGACLILSSRRIDALQEVKSSLTNPEKHHILPLDLANSKISTLLPIMLGYYLGRSITSLIMAVLVNALYV